MINSSVKFLKFFFRILRRPNGLMFIPRFVKQNFLVAFLKMYWFFIFKCSNFARYYM